MPPAPTEQAKPPDEVVSDWAFLTSHAHVLVLLAREPRSTVAQLARALDVEEPNVEAILKDLENTGYIRAAVASTPAYAIDRARPLRHPVEAHHAVGRLLDAVQSPSDVLDERLAAHD